jgi:hypothetical protein
VPQEEGGDPPDEWIRSRQHDVPDSPRANDDDEGHEADQRRWLAPREMDSPEADDVYDVPNYWRIRESPHFLRLGDSKSAGFSAALSALSDLITQDLPTAAVTGAVAELAQRYRHLNRDEMAVFDVLCQLAQGGSVYKVWIAEDELLAAMGSRART